MAVFNEKREEIEHYEIRMGVPRGRLAVTMDLVTDAKELIQSVMEELTPKA